jgi:hypothetical protein
LYIFNLKMYHLTDVHRPICVVVRRPTR